MNSWKENLREVPGITEQFGLPVDVENFISTEIIEKLIADIPDNITVPLNQDRGFYSGGVFKQQLRDKWLGQKSEPKPRPPSKELRNELNRAEFAGEAFDKGW